MLGDLVVSAGLVIPEAELEWIAIRSSGPGGQNVNKVSSKVELRFAFERSSALAGHVKARLREIARTRMDATGRIRIVSQATRNLPQNLEDARQKLAALIRAAMSVPKRRRPTAPTRGSRERRLEQKQIRAQKKQARGRVRGDEG
jgi:ribosome-associated protein